MPLNTPRRAAQEARSDDNEMATDNAVSALGALLAHHSDVLDGDALAAAWVAGLPIKGDAVEAVRAHAQLVALLEVRRGATGGGGWRRVCLPHLFWGGRGGQRGAEGGVLLRATACV